MPSLLHPRLHWRGHLCRRLGLHRGVITSGLSSLGRRRGRRAEEVGGRRRGRVHAGRRRLRRRLRWRLVAIARRWGRALLSEGGRAEVLLVRGRGRGRMRVRGRIRARGRMRVRGRGRGRVRVRVGAGRSSECSEGGPLKSTTPPSIAPPSTTACSRPPGCTCSGLGLGLGLGLGFELGFELG